MDNREKRLFLLERMDELNKQNINCKGCGGDCCTFVANSMQITKDEGKVLFSYLEKQTDREELLLKLKKCINHYRLDRDTLGNGKRASFIRRTYTCPFFEGRELGCSIPAAYKPYGCLAFNPKLKGQGLDCISDQELLEKQAAYNGHTEEELKDKKPIPVMLVQIIEGEN